MSEIETRDARELHAYHDGELFGLARWRFERRLRRSPVLQRELGDLTRIAAWVRESEARAVEPDLWDRIELRLPALDARGQAARERAPAAGWPWRPVGAMAAAALAIFAVYFALQPSARAPGGAVRWLDSGGRSVMVVDDPDLTIIWMLDDAVEGAARGGRGEVA